MADSAHAEVDLLRRLTEHENAGLGVVTGVIEQAAVQPFVYSKNALQQGMPLTANPRILYRGTLASCCNMASLTGQQFLASGYFQKLLAGGSGERLSYSSEVMAGFLGGAISGPTCCVLELVMIQQQRFGGSMLATPVRLVQAHGLLGLTRGMTGSVGRESLFCAGYLGTVPATQKWTREHLGAMAWMGDCLSAGTAAVLCAAVTQPLDTVKTCMQGDLERKKYGTMSQTFVALYREHGGLGVFYRGYWWRFANIIADFALLNVLAKYLATIVFPDR
mmetsp:Transcript_33451/g.73189  ORF Transcript_33451/g.73189 Transcript_33451/m.73189 type:complete len:277 (-) Transcript_33451:144-974(-)|eukprot:CAMPEP_0170581820 /NCGR_PEP_ID=MMETSP0224-20130122/7245_1 /TAXON_ID=285029 /ORGANISM="Togula jolla, Strain CCCM 725" /LENGTH=276 /DNA_ID=CAMNT_0010904985 /DNA_START=53 /DNA_END=883 /DNA_ORIENTATION=+